MGIDQARSKRKPSGGRLMSYRKTPKHALGREPTYTKIGKTVTKTERAVGGNNKHKLRAVNTINVVDQKKNKTTKATIETAVDNKANPNFIRRNILTKGAVVQTSVGKVRITSRPGQETTLNGVLVE